MDMCGWMDEGGSKVGCTHGGWTGLGRSDQTEVVERTTASHSRQLTSCRGLSRTSPTRSSGFSPQEWWVPVLPPSSLTAPISSSPSLEAAALSPRLTTSALPTEPRGQRELCPWEASRWPACRPQEAGQEAAFLLMMGLIRADVFLGDFQSLVPSPNNMV